MTGNRYGGSDPTDSNEFGGRNLWLFILVIIFWGTSWIAIQFQVGVVARELSVAYRFGLAALIMFAIVIYTRRRLTFSRRDHLRFLIVGLAMFSINFLLFYYAAQYIVSGFLALMFSLASIFNLLNSWIILRVRPPRKLFLAALFGITGLAAIFLPSLSGTDLGSNPAKGILLALLATYSFSIGNIASAGYRERGIPVYSANAYAMAYGAISMALLAILLGKPFNFDFSPPYLISLLGLAVFSSVVAFAAYVTLIGKIGAPRAGYITVVFPLLALAISTLFEGYQWSLWGILGLVLILTGNVIVLRK